MKIVMSVLIIAFCLVSAFCLALISRNPSAKELQLTQAVAEKKAEIALLEAKTEHNREFVKAKRELQALETRRRIEAGWVYRTSLTLAYSLKNLWFLWLLL